MIVLACNIATAVVWEEIKEKLDIPVLGVILPGASAAIKSLSTWEDWHYWNANDDSIRIFIGKKSRRLLPEVEVTSLSCPKFVPLVESNELSSSITKKVVYESLMPLKGKVDTFSTRLYTLSFTKTNHSKCDGTNSETD